jgi:hypothetical protein
MLRSLRRLLTCLVLATTCFTAGCAVDPDDAPASPSSLDSTPTSAVERESRVDPPTRATLLAVRLSTTHVVTFTESSDGDLEVVERMHADLDRGQPSLAAIDATGATMAQLHRHLLPGAPVPTALLEADGRAAARPTAPADVTPPDDAFSIADTEYPAPLVAGWDWIADSNLFAQYYYTGGTAGFFAANSGHIWQTKKRWTKWYKSSGFNQSFEGGGWFRLKRSYGCGISVCSETVVNEAVPNRMILTYLGDSIRWRQSWMDGNGFNPRVALAVRWVLNNSSAPPAPQAGCGGHTEYICFTGNRCKPGLVEYNLGCYGCGTVGQACCKDWGPIPTSGGVNGFCTQGHCSWPGGNCSIY